MHTSRRQTDQTREHPSSRIPLYYTLGLSDERHDFAFMNECGVKH